MNTSIQELADQIITLRRITFDQIKTLRRGIFSEEQIAAHMFDEGIVDRDEAEMLFQINDAISGAEDSDLWRDLFVEALTTHVLKDEMSAGELDAEEAEFVIRRIDKDGKIDSAELELLVSISGTVADAPDFFHRYVRKALAKDIARHGVVDETRARWLRRVVFGPGSSSGRAVDESETQWLSQLDRIVLGKSNHPAWEILKYQVGIA